MAPPDHLRILADLLAFHPAADKTADTLAAVRAVIAGDPDSLDEALGLKPAPGARSWRTVASLEERDLQVRAAASDFNLSAPDIAARLARYASTAWPRDRAATTCPTRLEGKPEACFWRCLRAWPRPVGLRQIQKTLRTELGLFSSRDPAESGQDENQE